MYASDVTVCIKNRAERDFSGALLQALISVIK